MIHIREAIVVEGHYDKERLKALTDAPILCTNGFALYRSAAILNSIRRFARERGLLILTDSDQAGFRIRNYLKSCLGPDCVIKHAYIPAVSGKERRKKKPGKEGLLGVEGIDEETLREILAQAVQPAEPEAPVQPVTKADLYADGLSGRADSAARREALIRQMGLPPRLSANALLELLNRTGGYPAYRQALDALEAHPKTGPSPSC